MAWLAAVTSVASAVGSVSRADPVGTVSNLLGGTSGTCGKLPTREQLAVILAQARPDEPEMYRTRRRYMQGKRAEPDMDRIYKDPFDTVYAWSIYDCRSAGEIRQSLAADLAALASRYGNVPLSAAVQPSVTERIGTVANTVDRLARAAAGEAVPSRTTQEGLQQVYNVLPLVLIGIGAVWFARTAVRK